MGFEVWTVEALAGECGAVVGYDEAAGSKELDLDVLGRHVSGIRVEGDAFIDGHLSHRLPVAMVIVLRCNPKVLAERLGPRSYPPEKLRENLEAEAVDVILIEATESLGKDKVYEIDTTYMSAENGAEAVLEILSGKGERYAPGGTDWSEEVLGWY